MNLTNRQDSYDLNRAMEIVGPILLSNKSILIKMLTMLKNHLQDVRKTEYHTLSYSLTLVTILKNES